MQRNSVSFSVCSISNHCSNCGDILSFTRGLTIALGSAVASKFGRRLFDAFFCKESGDVDCAFIVAMYKSLVYAKLAYRNPRVIFFKILEEYTLNGDSRSDEVKTVADVLKIISIAAITSEEYKFTSGLLKDELANSRENSIISSLEELEILLDKLPSVLYNFRLQLVNQMPSDAKLELLDALEDESLCVFIDASKRVGVKRMHAFRLRRMWNCFNGWRREIQYSNYVRQRIKWTALSAWKKEAHRLATARMLEEISVISCYKALIRRHFIKWRRLVLIKNRIQRICISEDIDKEVRAASGHLRIAARLIKLRLSHATWVAFTLLERKVEHAKCWHDRKITRSSILALREYSSRERKQRKRLREATIIQQRRLIRQRQQESLLELERNRHCNSSSKKWTSKQASMMRGSNEAKLQTRQLSQRELGILEAQRNLRRARVAQRKAEMEKAFNSKWLMKQAECLAAGTKRIEGWMKTVDYKILFEEQEKHYKNILSDRIDEEAERALSSNDVISYSNLDALLANVAVVPETVFDALPDPFDRLAFQNALEKEASLDTDQVCRIFEGLTGGQSEFISKTRLVELQRTSHRYLGLEGSQWKMFVCSKSRQIILHNISSGQKITSIRKKHIQQVIRENIVSCENLKLRRAFYQMKKQAHRSMLEQHSAKIIQHMFRRWKRRALVNRKLWFVDRLRIKTAKHKEEARAARVIQNVFRQKKLKMK